MEILAKEEHLQRQLAPFLVQEAAPDASLPHDLAAIVRYVHAHLFDTRLSVGEALQRCGVGNHNASSRFKATLGVGLREYIERQRLDAAKLLLRTTHAEVYLIAEAVGYEYVESFARAFHRVVGCTPCGYRDRARRGRSANDCRVRVEAKS